MPRIELEHGAQRRMRSAGVVAGFERAAEVVPGVDQRRIELGCTREHVERRTDIAALGERRAEIARDQPILGPCRGGLAQERHGAGDFAAEKLQQATQPEQFGMRGISGERGVELARRAGEIAPIEALLRTRGKAPHVGGEAMQAIAHRIGHRAKCMRARRARPQYMSHAGADQPVCERACGAVSGIASIASSSTRTSSRPSASLMKWPCPCVQPCSASHCS